MNFSPDAAAVCVGLWLGMIACLEVGYRVARRDLSDTRAHRGVGVIEAAIFGLLGLLLGFEFAGAMTRFDRRIQLVVREANAISSAYQLVDLLTPNEQATARGLFRAYLEARLRTYDPGAPEFIEPRALREAADLQRRLWDQAMRASHSDPTNNVARLLLPALADMMNVTTARFVAVQSRLPPLIVFLMVVVALLTSLIAGYAMAERGRRSLLHLAAYPLIVSVTVYVVLDLDDPRYGLIRVDAAERVLRELHDSIR